MKPLIAFLVGAVALVGVACLGASSAVQAPTAGSGQASAAAGGCNAAGTRPATPPPVTSAAQSAYVIGIGDTLEIDFKPDVDPRNKCSGPYTVGSDGKINFCTVGPIKIDNLTERDAEETIKKASGAANYVTNPQVTVQVKTYRSQSVWVFGEVGRPGEVTISGGPNEMTLMKVISQASNFKEGAGPDVFVLRKPGATGPIPDTDATASRLTYSRRWMTESMIDPPIQAGDTISVPQAEYFQIIGEVKNGGKQMWEPCITIAEAVAKAGGLNDKASLGRSSIQRKDPKTGKFVKIDIKGKQEMTINANDIVTIGRRLM